MSWPLTSLPALLATLAEELGEGRERARVDALGDPPAWSCSDAEPDPTRQLDALERWVARSCTLLGVELESVSLELGDLDASLPQLGPALLPLPSAAGGPPRLLLITTPHRRDRVPVIYPDLRRGELDLATLVDDLQAPRRAPLVEECEAILTAADVPPRRRVGALAQMLDGRLAGETFGPIWQLRLPPEAALPKLLTEVEAPRSLAILLVAHVAHYLIAIASWWLIGRGVLEGRSELGWLLAWALLLLTALPLQALRRWHMGLVGLRVGAVVKRKLLTGALALEPDALRSRGIGRMLALVIESEAVEALAISTGLTALAAIIDLLVSTWVLSRGAGAWILTPLLLGWLAVIVALGWRYGRARLRWARARLTMTHDLVERMVGHTTRLAQEDPRRWHESEDAATATYLRSSTEMDGLAARLWLGGTRGWMLLAVLGLGAALVDLGAASSTVGLAIAFGGVLLAQAAFVNLSAGIGDLIDLGIAWREVGPLMRAASLGPNEVGASPSSSSEHTAQPVIEARELSFRYPDRERSVLRDCELVLEHGDRVLLEGPSGGGKSTLAALLAGLRRPSEGLLLLEGLDPPSRGAAGWRELVAAAPQFHQNHIFTGTFAFNLLMGRRWPPRTEDLELAEDICAELGLVPLLHRMPAGMMQPVGETGWQLSHGERSRVYLARALLQDAELVILDESLAALDPDNQARAIECVKRRTNTLVVIAHP